MTYAPPPPYAAPDPAGGWRPHPPEPPKHPLTVAGFVVALVGAVLALIPLVGIVSWIVSPVGLILSIIAVCAARPGRILAIWGVALGAIGLIICIGWVVMLAGAAHSTSTSSTYGSSSGGSSYASSTTDSTATGTYRDGTYRVGSEIAPGQYRTGGADSSALFQFCMASRQDSTGRAIGIPETTNTGPAYVTVGSSDAMVEFSGPCTWSRVG